MFIKKLKIIMNKLIKEILTNKKARNFSALMALIVTVMGVGQPWIDV